MDYIAEEWCIGGADRIGKPFDDVTFSLVKEAMQRIQNLSNEMDFFTIIFYNLRSFMNTPKKRGVHGEPDLAMINGCFSNYLNSFYTWKCFNKHEFDQFDTLHAGKKDKNIAYKFGDRLRNYVAHNAFAITSCEYDVLQERFIGIISPSELLNGDKWRGNVLNWLSDQERKEEAIDAYAGINEFEHIRQSLRDLIKYIPVHKLAYETNFDDELLTMDWKEAELENDDLKNYKLRAEFYVRKNQDNAVIAKLRGNEPLTNDDLKVLERILWSEVGTKQDYETEFGAKPLGEFVREIVGLDMHAAKEAFSEYLSDTSLDADQIYFVNQIIEYIVHNGLMKDLSVLQESPFTDHGSIVEVFADLTVWLGIKRIIDQINANAVAV